MSAKLLIRFSILALVIVGCGGTTPPVKAPRITPHGEATPLNPSDSSEDVNAGIQFLSLASVKPLESEDGFEMQATNFAFSKEFVVVSYNRAGNEVRGAIEVFDLSNPKKPKIVGSLQYKDAEFSDVKIKDQLAYAVGSDGVNGAVLKVISLENPEAPTEKASVPLEGFYATSVSIQGDSLFITSGDNRGLIELSTGSFERKNEWKLPSATFVFASENSVLLAGGDPYSFYQIANDELFEVTRFSEKASEAPSRFAVSADYLVANPTNEGLLVYKFNEKASVAKLISQTPVKGTGNGIDLYKNYVFMAQGDAGVRIYNLDQADEPKYVGLLDYSNRGSANQVKYGNVLNSKENWNCLLVADGAGGFEVLKFELKN